MAATSNEIRNYTALVNEPSQNWHGGSICKHKGTVEGSQQLACGIPFCLFSNCIYDTCLTTFHGQTTLKYCQKNNSINIERMLLIFEPATSLCTNISRNQQIIIPVKRGPLFLREWVFHHRIGHSCPSSERVGDHRHKKRCSKPVPASFLLGLHPVVQRNRDHAA